MSKQHDLYVTTAEAAAELARQGIEAIESDDYDKAASVYALMNEISHSMAVALRVSCTNRLKLEILPANLVEVNHTGDESPLLDSDPGQYL